MGADGAFFSSCYRMITFFLTICMIVVWVESANFAAGIFQVG